MGGASRAYRYHRWFLIRAICQLHVIQTLIAYEEKISDIWWDMSLYISLVAWTRRMASWPLRIHLSRPKLQVQDPSDYHQLLSLTRIAELTQDKKRSQNIPSILSRETPYMSANLLICRQWDLRFGKTSPDPHCREHDWSKEHKEGFHHTRLKDYPRW